jgi:hypothetical protein
MRICSCLKTVDLYKYRTCRQQLTADYLSPLLGTSYRSFIISFGACEFSQQRLQYLSRSSEVVFTIVGVEVVLLGIIDLVY